MGDLFLCPSDLFFLLWSRHRGSLREPGRRNRSPGACPHLHARRLLPPGRLSLVPSIQIPSSTFYDLSPPLLVFDGCWIIFLKPLACSGPALPKSEASFSFLTGLCASHKSGNLCGAPPLIFYTHCPMVLAHLPHPTPKHTIYCPWGMLAPAPLPPPLTGKQTLWPHLPARQPSSLERLFCLLASGRHFCLYPLPFLLYQFSLFCQHH